MAATTISWKVSDSNRIMGSKSLNFHEDDTVEHCWQVLSCILRRSMESEYQQMVIDTGMPVLFQGLRYNCRVILRNGRVLLIRPKMFLANDGNYRETRWFTPWMGQKVVVDFELPDSIFGVSQQRVTRFGDAVLSINGYVFWFEEFKYWVC